jgi:hypothetical protein
VTRFEAADLERVAPDSEELAGLLDGLLEGLGYEFVGLVSRVVHLVLLRR